MAALKSTTVFRPDELSKRVDMLEFRDLWKSYEGKPLLEGISLRVGEGETVCLLGPSGSGKSTLLRIAAGLEMPDRGSVFRDGEDITGMPAHLRGFGLMFQDYALFPHLSVAENVAFGLRVRGLPRSRVELEAREALERVNLGSYGSRRVAELSGGEQQRVALARALAPRPRLLMLDEPLGALDRALREEMIEEIRRVLRSMRIPSLYVTHDQEEAFTVAARVAILHSGRIVQTGTPEEIVSRPASVWTARFLGLGNLLSGRVQSRSPMRVTTALGGFSAESPQPAPPIGTEGWVLLRLGGGEWSRANKRAADGIRGVVGQCVRRETGYRVVLETAPGEEIVCHSADPIRVGEDWIWIPAKGLWIAG
jgi:spermidine/putrescine transport system ATP-binding protein